VSIREKLKAAGEWLVSSRSDLLLYLIIIVLANIAAADLYFRVDLTRSDMFTLSPASRELVSAVEAPLGIKVFFTGELPAPYNGVERYLRDLLEEYERAAGPDFSVDFYDMEKPENKEAAANYGINPSTIQEIKSDQFQSRSVYMGLSILYGDSIEILDQITNTAGLEYRLTTTMQRMISSVDILHGITGKPVITLYASEALSGFGIEGFDRLEETLQSAVESLDRDIRERLTLRLEDPDDRRLAELKREYGVQIINWGRSVLPDGSIVEAGSGAMDIVLSYGDSFRLIPLNISQKLFGGYVISGMENLSERIRESLTAMLSNNPAVGYLTGHGELDLSDPQNGAASLAGLISDIYRIQPIEDIDGITIPDSIRTLIINGAKSGIDRSVLYDIDQFLMRGGSLLIFHDPFVVSQAAVTAPNQPPQYIPSATGLEELLETYGVNLRSAYVLDNESFIQRDPQYGELNIYWAPVLSGSGISDSHIITRGLGELIALQNGSLSLSEELENSSEIDAQIILSSSKESWLLEENIQLNPLGMVPPAKETLQSYPLAAALEGTFTSAFPEAPEGDRSEDSLTASAHLKRSVAPGRIAVVTSSLFTSPQLLDPRSINANSAFVHNLLDWSSGSEKVIPMRVKGLGRNKLVPTRPEIRNLLKGIAIILLPLLLILTGLLVWRFQKRRRRAIEQHFAGGNYHAEK
jgi:ABC-type uncharacterized transport system involved in gliding motility auxiliary subunit